MPRTVPNQMRYDISNDLYATYKEGVLVLHQEIYDYNPRELGRVPLEPSAVEGVVTLLRSTAYRTGMQERLAHNWTAASQ